MYICMLTEKLKKIYYGFYIVSFVIVYYQDNTIVPDTPLFSAKILKEDEDMWQDVQVCYDIILTLDCFMLVIWLTDLTDYTRKQSGIVDWGINIIVLFIQAKSRFILGGRDACENELL